MDELQNPGENDADEDATAGVEFNMDDFLKQGGINFEEEEAKMLQDEAD